MKGEFSMSNKLKQKKGKGDQMVIPESAKNATYDSLPALGSALGVKPADQPTPKAKKCRKCGKPMRHVPGTNVWLCDTMVEVEQNGVKKMVPCGNRAITAVNPVPQSSAPGDKKDTPKGKPSGKPKAQPVPATA